MVNFLKRKRNVRPGILLYHNLLNNKATAYQVRKTISCEQSMPVTMHSESVECSSELPDGDNVEPKYRQKAKENIEKLLVKIHDLMTVDDLNRQRTYAVTKLHEDTTNNQKHDHLSGNSEPEQSCIEQAKGMKTEDVEPSLNIQELQTIAAMAKRLNTHSKK